MIFKKFLGTKNCKYMKHFARNSNSNSAFILECYLTSVPDPG